MFEMDQMERYTLYPIVVTWTANFFMVLFINCLFPIQSTFQDLNYLFTMEMGHTQILTSSIYVEKIIYHNTK